MKILRETALILFFALVGEAVNRLAGVPVPGSIIGMVLLLLALLTGVVKERQIETVGNFLLAHLAVLFIPAGVGLMAVAGYLEDAWLAILLLSVGLTVVVMAVTSLVVAALRKAVD